MFDVARCLKAAGYCRVSNRKRIVSRIDRPDWYGRIARHHGDWKGLNAQWPSGSWCDFYRRVESRDTMSVSLDLYNLLPSSDWNPIGYHEFGPEEEAVRDWLRCRTLS